MASGFEPDAQVCPPLRCQRSSTSSHVSAVGCLGSGGWSLGSGLGSGVRSPQSRYFRCVSTNLASEPMVPNTSLFRSVAAMVIP